MVFDASFWAAYPVCSSFMCIFPLTFLNSCSTRALVIQNPCWCPNVAWLNSLATCVGQRCPSEVSQVYSTIETNCLTSGSSQPGISLDEWLTASHSQPENPVVSGVYPLGYDMYPECSQYMCLLPDVYSNPCAHTGNVCVCNNVTEIEGWAKCIGTDCPADVGQVYSTALANCQLNGGYNIAVSLNEFMAVAEGSKAVASYSPTDGNTTPTSTGLSREDQIQLGVGLSMGLLAVGIGIGGIWVGWKTYRQRLEEVRIHRLRSIELGINPPRHYE
jgi:hypothetical protein